jgi:hypothetical protein
VPSVGGCILLRPTQSVGLHLQMIGRCLRPSGNKTAVVLDHVGNTLRLGHHLEDRDWTLDGARKRDSDRAPSVKVCPVCFSTSPSATQVCPDCGHVFAPQETRELKVVEGELVEIQSKGQKIAKIAVGDIVYTHHGMDGLVEIEIVKITPKKVAYWVVGKDRCPNQYPYHTWHYCLIVPDFKNGDRVLRRNTESKEQEWESGWVFYKYFMGEGKGKRVAIVKEDYYDFNSKSPKSINQTNYLYQNFEKNGCKMIMLHNVKHPEQRPDPTPKEVRREQGSAQSLEDLRKLAQQRGYKRGWAERVYQARLAKRHGL